MKLVISLLKKKKQSSVDDSYCNIKAQSDLITSVCRSTTLQFCFLVYMNTQSISEVPF